MPSFPGSRALSRNGLAYIPGMGSIGVGPLDSHDLRTKGVTCRPSRRSAVGLKNVLVDICIWRDGT